jgi:hypothetical protein
MKIKTITHVTTADIDRVYNEFGLTNNIKFSQSHVTNTSSGLVYTMVIFYE